MRTAVIVHFDWRPVLDHLSMEQQGELFNAILDYGEEGILPNFTGPLAMAWDMVRARMDRDMEKYEETCRRRQAAARQRWSLSQDEVQ